MNDNKTNENNLSKEEYLYHNTEVLLKKYREVVLSIGVSVTHAKMKLSNRFSNEISDLFEICYGTGIDMSGTQILSQLRTLERNKKMLELIQLSVKALRGNSKYGEEYYWVLYYTYLSKTVYRSIDDILDALYQQAGIYMSQKTYFKYRKAAITKLSTILWGFTSKDSLDIIDKFV